MRMRKINRTSAAAWVLVLIMLGSLFLPCALAEAAAQKPLAGRTISVMGDSISTYMGWSDKYPITDPSCTNRYGEPYYGPVGSDCHNTELLVTDTWWHQAATELGAEILMSNAGNSTGLLCASYPQNADWDLYLKELLAYKSRPYYMGRDGRAPDIIALYIGSNELARATADQLGSIEATDLDTLIQENGGGYTYATPTTVAESYCILLHKLFVTYPNAEIYCFAPVPSAGGNLKVFNQRVARSVPFNEMVRGVAEYFGLPVVELPAAFGYDPDGDGFATQAAFDQFQTCYNNDPHPNAAGFDVITRCFVDTVLKNSRYIANVETRGGSFEPIGVEVIQSGAQTVQSAVGAVTENGYRVDYRGVETENSFLDRYTVRGENNYRADGGTERTWAPIAPNGTISVPLTDRAGRNTASAEKTKIGQPVVTGDTRNGADDGVYNYETTYVQPDGGIRVETTRFRATNPIAMETSANMSFVASSTRPTADNNMVTTVKELDRPSSAAEVPAIAQGYEFVYLGSDQLSNFYSAHAKHSPYDSYPEEVPFYADSNGLKLYLGADIGVFKQRKLMVPRMYLGGRVIEGETPARYDSIQQFTLANADGKLITTYCAQQGTETQDGYSYRLRNLEDSSYYGLSDAQMIRTVANNGYWGTASGYGSLSALHEMMRSSGKFTESEIAATTDGIAMTATQYAIWTFSNGENGTSYYNAYYTKNGKAPSRAADKADADLIFKLYEHLISLAPTPRRLHTKSTVINEKNFITDVSLAVKEKADHPNNRDADADNDVYLADLSFTMAAKPSTENGDHLLMRIRGINDGGDLLIRVAGTPKAGEIAVNPDENRVCTVENLAIREGAQSVDFFMSGTQVLEKDVHLLLSEERDGVISQTMVGIAEGPRDVAVLMSLSFNLDVSDDVSVHEHIYRTEGQDIPPTGDGQHPMLLLLLIGLCGAGLCLKRKIKNRIY